MAAAVVGRESVLVAVDTVLAAARVGLTALVLEGEAGIGKTTVWREGAARAANHGYRVLSCRAATSETRLSFTALSDLLAPVEPAAFDALPVPQRKALDAALLRSESTDGTPNPRAIGTAIVSLVAEVGAAAPVLIAIDDLQWLDLPSARALEFALRRLETHPVAVLATVRLGERGNGTSLLAAGADDRVRRLRVGPLSLAALYRIVEDKLGHGLPRPLLVRIERACGGNPFYALEIARALDVEGTAARGRELPIPDDLRELVAKRLRKLPQRTREALLRVSALAQPTIAYVHPADLGPAEEAGVVRLGVDSRVEFAHPLFAAAVYASASLERKQTLHVELAEIASNIEERARHLMLARTSDIADEHIAAVLHRAAEHALGRGAIEIAADLDEASAKRTPAQHAAVRWHRWLRAARHYLKAGDPARSRAICEAVLNEMPPSSTRADALGLLAEGRLFDRPDAAIPLLEEALACVGDDAAHAAQLEVSLGFLFLAVFKVAQAETHLVHAVDLAERSGDTALMAEAIALKALAGLFAGKGVDQKTLDKALALENVDREVRFQMRASFNAAQVSQYIGNLNFARELLTSLRDRLVVRGEETDLAWVLAQLAATDMLAGRLELAEQEATDAERIAVLTGVEGIRAFAIMVRAMARTIRGNTEGGRADATEVIAVAERIGWPHGAGQSRFVLGVLALSEGDPKTAVAMLDPVISAVEAVGVYEWQIAMMVPDAIEAFVATGDLERARRLTKALTDWGRKFDRPWALATSGRCRALLAGADGDLESACAAAAQALVDHERLPMPFELGRTLLVQGRLQRRLGERRAARETLQRGLAIFEQIGAPLWAQMARHEVSRIGVRRAPEALTEGEQRSAELAAQGLTNPEIAARLFMSRRTVEANLARAYRKLGIRSRAELGAVMSKPRIT